jgi:Beta propeller domain
MTVLPRVRAAVLVACVGLGVLSGCSSDDDATDKGVPTGSFRLVAFDSCEQALDGLRAAAKSVVGPYGFWSGGITAQADAGAGAKGGAGAEAGAQPPQAAAPGAARDESKSSGAGPDGGGVPNYSGTNTHEAGVDEPDLVKTDGRRIITVTRGTLRVVDAASRSLIGFVELADGINDMLRYAPTDLLISGDHALVLLRQDGVAQPAVAQPAVDRAAVDRAGAVAVGSPQVAGPRLILVSLSGQPRVLSSVQAEGSLIDARQVGSTARVVLRSSPHISFPYAPDANDAQRVQANRDLIDQAGIDAWLPRIDVTTGGVKQRVGIGCEAVSRPAVYTATSLLTILSYDLKEMALGDGRPTTLVADGDTVYSNGASMYVSSDQRWRALPSAEENAIEARTEIYKFDTSTAERPTFIAGGSVPGYLINQYAMSEWGGNLRVATTIGEPRQGQQQPTSQSGVYVLAQRGTSLNLLGSVEGIGKGERIYAVRFAGPVGYVVTFRRTDPLYTVDVSDPSEPAIRGELKIPGYSAYLHPTEGSRLIGIGQDATDGGRVTGTQVSVFDVTDLTKPERLAQYRLSGTHSEAEFDPHAFLYWPADGLLVVPLHGRGAAGVPGGTVPGSGGTVPGSGSGGTVPGGAGSGGAPGTVGALVLRVQGTSIEGVGFIEHPGSAANGGYPSQIRRSLIIDQTLWTVSDGGLMANDSRSLARVGWIPFD